MGVPPSPPPPPPAHSQRGNDIASPETVKNTDFAYECGQTQFFILAANDGTAHLFK